MAIRRFEILPPQPRNLNFREYSFIDEKGLPNAGFSYPEESLETVDPTIWAKIPKSLRPNTGKLPFSRDSRWRPENKSTAC